MRTLHIGLRVSDLGRSLAFYTAVGYTVTGTVEGTALGSLSMLQLPGDPFVAIELVHDPATSAATGAAMGAATGAAMGAATGAAATGTGLSHLVVQVESLDAVLASLAASGIAAEPPGLPGGADGPRTSWITDPDGYRIELVQWPPGHADGMTRADFA
jgi:lactoylglutathione lyase